MHLPDPKLPPRFTGYAVSAPVCPLEAAAAGAASRIYEAGDVVWSRDTQRMALALVLEPDVPLGTAFQMNALAQVAVAETIGHLGPIKTSVLFRWPGIILVNGAVCGEITLVSPPSEVAAVPQWLVVGATLALSAPEHAEPGDNPDSTTLSAEGLAASRTQLIEALSARLLAWLHTWQHDGFRPIHEQWLFHAEGREADVDVDGMAGRVLGLDDTGNLLLKSHVDGRMRAVPMQPHVRVPS